MNYLFECLLTVYGAPGGTAYYIVFKSTKSYWCKMKNWNQYRGKPCGDFALWKEGKNWKYTGDVSSMKQDIVNQVVFNINNWNGYSDKYKEELSREFKYVDDQP